MPGLIGHVIEFFHPSIRLLGVQVEKKYTTCEPVLAMDGEIRQVLINLIGKALDEMPSDGTLSVRVCSIRHPSSQRLSIRVTVEDTGLA